MRNAALWFCIFISAMLMVFVPSKEKTPYKPVFDAETPEKEQTLNIPVMVFTEEEADSLLSCIKKEKEEAKKASERKAVANYSPAYFKRAGVILWGGWRWTWYSERILPGYGLRIKGRHTDAQGYVRDGDGFLCLASDALRKGTVIATPFGSYGKVYDCGCGMKTIDVYVGW